VGVSLVPTLQASLLAATIFSSLQGELILYNSTPEVFQETVRNIDVNLLAPTTLLINAELLCYGIDTDNWGFSNYNKSTGERDRDMEGNLYQTTNDATNFQTPQGTLIPHCAFQIVLDHDQVDQDDNLQFCFDGPIIPEGGSFDTEKLSGDQGFLYVKRNQYVAIRAQIQPDRPDCLNIWMFYLLDPDSDEIEKRFGHPRAEFPFRLAAKNSSGKHISQDPKIGVRNPPD
jgi:hypothetical protein